MAFGNAWKRFKQWRPAAQTAKLAVAAAVLALGAAPAGAEARTFDGRDLPRFEHPGHAYPKPITRERRLKIMRFAVFAAERHADEAERELLYVLKRDTHPDIIAQKRRAVLEALAELAQARGLLARVRDTAP